MLWHDHVTDDDKVMALAGLLHDFEEEMARLGRAKKGPPRVATGGDEVKVSPSHSSRDDSLASRRYNMNARIWL